MSLAAMERPTRADDSFGRQANAIRDRLLVMSEIADQMLLSSVQALLGQNAASAAVVIEQDDRLDALEVQVEDEVFHLLETPPVADSDLRFLSSALKIATDLERIGDHAVNIAKSTQRMAANDVGSESVVDFCWFVGIAREMLRDSMRAFIGRDIALARAVIEQDDEADVFYSEAQRELRRDMPQTGKSLALILPVRASHLLFVAHDLERVCDHCTNIAERVIFLETGEFIVPERGHQEWKS